MLRKCSVENEMELQEYGLDSTLLLVYLGGLNGINF